MPNPMQPVKPFQLKIDAQVAPAVAPVVAPVAASAPVLPPVSTPVAPPVAAAQPTSVVSPAVQPEAAPAVAPFNFDIPEDVPAIPKVQSAIEAAPVQTPVQEVASAPIPEALPINMQTVQPTMEISEETPLQAMSRLCEELKEQLNKYTSTLGVAAITGLNETERSNFEQQVSNLQAANTELQTKNDELSNRLAASAKLCEEQKKAIAALEADKAKLDAERTNLATAVKQYEIQIAELEQRPVTDTTMLEARIAELEAALANAEQGRQTGSDTTKIELGNLRANEFKAVSEQFNGFAGKLTPEEQSALLTAWKALATKIDTLRA